jgi:hypothetical protein
MRIASNLEETEKAKNMAIEPAPFMELPPPERERENQL